MGVPAARLGRPRLRKSVPGQPFRVELRLPETDADLLYSAAKQTDMTVSALVAALIRLQLAEEVDPTDDL